jgi:hypothetical protein
VEEVEKFRKNGFELKIRNEEKAKLQVGAGMVVFVGESTGSSLSIADFVEQN